MSDKLCIRKSDATVWEPSCPDDYTEGDALATALLGRPSWYFRHVEWESSPWWKFWTRGKWVRTGDIWKPESGEFMVVSHDAAATPQEDG